MIKPSYFKQLPFLAGIAAAVAAAWWFSANYEYTEIWIRNAGLGGPFFAISLYGLLSLTPIPSDPLTVLCVAIYGWQRGFLISWFGNTLAAFVEYYIFKKIRQISQDRVNETIIPVWLKKWPVDSPIFLIGGRMIPGFGSKAVSVAAGIYKVSWWKFLYTTAAANLVGSALWVLSSLGLIKLF